MEQRWLYGEAQPHDICIKKLLTFVNARGKRPKIVKRLLSRALNGFLFLFR